MVSFIEMVNGKLAEIAHSGIVGLAAAGDFDGARKQIEKNYKVKYFGESENLRKAGYYSDGGSAEDIKRASDVLCLVNGLQLAQDDGVASYDVCRVLGEGKDTLAIIAAARAA